MPKEQGTHQPKLASINKSTIIQLTWLSHVTQFIYLFSGTKSIISVSEIKDKKKNKVK
jgi:hypothetical protein